MVGVLLTAGLFFRCYHLEKKAYWFDEALTSLYMSGHTLAEVQQIIGDREIGVQELTRFQHVNPDRGLLSTVRALSADNPHVSPPYYWLARLWVGLFGDTIRGIRSLSVFASLLVFPCLYWLCLELFQMRRVAWVALVLVAVSPFHVLYAQEARSYTLWATAILLSSAALLWSLRSNTKRGWALYATTIAIGIYTHSFFGFVIMGHGVYIIGNQLSRIGWKPLELLKTSTQYIIATLAGLAAFVPWAYIIVADLGKAIDKAAWLSRSVNPVHLIGMWAHNFSSVFLDTNHTLKSVVAYDFGTLTSYGIRVFILIMAAYSVYFLYSQTPRRTWLFVLTLTVVPMLMLAVPDLLLGGTRSGFAPRYLLPSYLGIQLAFAHLLSTKTTAAHPLRRRGWQAVSVLVLICGIVSCAISSQAETWWTKFDGALAKARIINQCDRPLLIMPVSGYLFSYSHVLHPKVRLWVAVKPEALEIRDGFSDVFVLNPFNLLPWLRQKLEQEEGFRIDVVEKRGEFWRLTKEQPHPQNLSGCR